MDTKLNREETFTILRALDRYVDDLHRQYEDRSEALSARAIAGAEAKKARALRVRIALESVEKGF